jgi:hypothetical protein
MTSAFVAPRSVARLLGFLAVISLGLLGPSIGSGLVFGVDSSEDAKDASPGDGVCATSAGVCTLRAAIQETNALPGEDAIEVPAGNYVLTIPGSDEDRACTGDLDISDDLILIGAGPGETIIDAAGLDRVLDVPWPEEGRPFLRVELAGVTVRGGEAEWGGGISADSAELSIYESAVEDNLGSGIDAFDLSLLVSGSTVEGNSSENPGGGIRADFFNDVTIEESTIRRNHSELGGGGVATGLSNVTIRDSEISKNSGRFTGGVSIGDTGSFLVERTTIRNNSSQEGTGGLGISEAAGRISNSTVARNESESGTGGIHFGFSSGAIVENTTISGNSGVGAGGVGVGASEFDSNSVSFSNSTIVDNAANRGAGIAGSGWLPLIDLRNSILAKNDASLGGPDCTVESLEGVPIFSGGHNILGDSTECSFESSSGDQVGTGDNPIDPGIGPLADNGGATKTHALLPGSPAIDAGSPEVPGSTEGACEPADQRGMQRPLDGDGDGDALCDIGAFERVRPALIDIRPRSDSNEVNLIEDRLIPVAILGSKTFDVDDVDVTTLAFGPGGAPPISVQSKLRASRLSRRDLNRDGKKDLLSTYRTTQTGIAFNDTQACLTGKTLDGTPFKGCDDITTEPSCGLGVELALLLPPLFWLRRRRTDGTG